MKSSAPVAGLAALLLAAGAVGCSQSTDSPAMTPAAAVARAAKSTGDLTSFRYTLTGEVPEQGRVEGEAVMRLEPEPAMGMKMTALDQGADGTVEIRLVDEVMYIGGGAGMAEELDGKKWMKFDLAATGADGALADRGAADRARQDPAAEAGFLTSAKDVEKTGTEEIDGVGTTRYSGTVTLDDLRASLKKKDAAAAERGEQNIERYAAMGVDELTMDLWVDGEDRTKRFRMRGDAAQGPLDMTITFHDVNKPVTVEAPPAGETADLEELLEGLGEG
ncbi:DUF1396 domain-containing protein [Streptomyces sp. bgisy022]|uniref:DUF1396 domain-containing protein n=1 Tax=Streptomyces sp. bgisy022 TaxID=3413769 RepID=UPI003D71AF7D